MMPNVVPGVRWQPINVGNRAARRKGRGLCGHVAVSGSTNLTPGPNADWHFYLPKEGPAIQYIDLDLQCWATGEGNSTMAAFESEGGLGTTAQVNAEPWNDNQLDWAARILRHMHDTEGVPLQVMASSHTSERGFGTHRLGVPGYMAVGGEAWSSSRGKLCPGDAKHAQRFEVVERAKQLNGTPTPVIDPRGPEMRVLRVKENGRMYTATDLEVAYIGDPAIAASATATWGEVKEVSQRELDLLSFDANARRARQRAEIVAAVAGQVSGSDVDEQALGQAVIAGLMPQLTTAFASRSGLTREDVEQVVRGVFGDAAAKA